MLLHIWTWHNKKDEKESILVAIELIERFIRFKVHYIHSEDESIGTGWLTAFMWNESFCYLISTSDYF